LAGVAHVLWECMALAVVAQVLPELVTLLACWLWLGRVQPLCGLLECSLLLGAAKRGHIEALAGQEYAAGCLWAVAMWCHCPAK
jgi:hypothetical protein